MNSKHKLGNVKQTVLIGRLLRGSILAMAVFALAFVVAPYIISEANAANHADVDVSWAQISLTLDPDYGSSDTTSTRGDVNFGEVLPTTTDSSAGAYGTQKVAKKTIRVTTDGAYYAVYLSMAQDTDDNSLNLTGSTQEIVATTGTYTAPAAFSQTGWGYAVPNSQTVPSGTTVASTPFAAASVYEGYDSYLAGTTNDNLTKTGTGSTAYNTGTWAAVPEYGSAQQIWKASNASKFTSGSDFDIYYSVMADASVMSGTYQNEILYTAMASTGDLDQVSNNLSRDTEYVTAGTVETIKIDLVSNLSTFSNDDVAVYIVPHYVFANNSYSVSSLTASNYAKCAVSNVTSAGTAATITCTMPAIDGTKIQIAGDNSTLAANDTNVTGEYDFWVHIDNEKYGVNDIDYVSQYKIDSVNAPSVVYAGLQSKGNLTNYKLSPSDTAGGYYITQMQEMKAPVCSNTNTWGKTLGADARVYPATATTAIAASTITDGYAIINSESTLDSGYTIASQSAKVGTGTFLLEDNRDNKTYLVRRLADGNCWMVQNLDLNLADFTSSQSKRLTAENTNLSSTNSPWIPDANLVAGDSTGKLEGGQDISTHQFQSEDKFGSTLIWGSICQAGTGPMSTNPTSACTSITAANNANSSWARSYNNDSATATSTGTGNGPAYITGQSRINDANTCKDFTNTSWVTHSECQMVGAVGSDSDPSNGNGLTRDTSWNPGEITDHGTGSTANYVNGSDTFTMRGSMYYGDYYNWYAATAETGQYNMGSSAQATDSICPKGWKLPVNADATYSWTKLLRTTYGLEGSGYTAGKSFVSVGKVMQLPLSIPMTGFYEWSNGTLYGRGQLGGYWSSTATATGSGTNAYYLYFHYAGNFNPQNSSSKVGGFTVRCVAE